MAGKYNRDTSSVTATPSTVTSSSAAFGRWAFGIGQLRRDRRGRTGIVKGRSVRSGGNVIARMKILSSDAVIEAAEKAGQLILDTYLSPNRTFVDLPDLINEMDPLRDFSEACRRELQSAGRR
jgi:hypothetical protein